MLIENTAHTVGIARRGIEREAGACFFGDLARTVVLGGELQVHARLPRASSGAAEDTDVDDRGKGVDHLVTVDVDAARRLAMPQVIDAGHGAAIDTDLDLGIRPATARIIYSDLPAWFMPGESGLGGECDWTTTAALTLGAGAGSATAAGRTCATEA